MSASSTLTIYELEVAKRKNKDRDMLPFVLEFYLKFETLYFNLAFPLMFKDSLVWFSVFWDSSIPGGGKSVVMGSEGGEIADHVATRATREILALYVYIRG